MNNLKIISLGQLVADVVVLPVDGLPPSGTARIVERIELRGGGCGLNTASILAKLKISTGVVGKIGRDDFGNFLLDQMKNYHLDTRGVKQDRNVRTSSAIVAISPSGERSFLYAPGGNEALICEDIDWDLIARANILHIGGIMKLTNLRTACVLKKAKQLGVATSLDTDWDTSGQWLKLIEDCLPHTDIFLPSLDEAQLISGKEHPDQIAEFFLRYGIKVFVLKMGERGCFIRTPSDRFQIPAFKVKVVDTTGAGDAFVAGFLAGYQKGWDLEKCGRLANACGGLCTTKIGTTDGIIGWVETVSFMETTDLQ